MAYQKDKYTDSKHGSARWSKHDTVCVPPARTQIRYTTCDNRCNHVCSCQAAEYRANGVCRAMLGDDFCEGTSPKGILRSNEQQGWDQEQRGSLAKQACKCPHGRHNVCL